MHVLYLVVLATRISAAKSIRQVLGLLPVPRPMTRKALRQFIGGTVRKTVIAQKR